MKWTKVYAQVGWMDVEIQGEAYEVLSFRMIAEVEGTAYLATHVVLKEDFEAMPEQYGHILDEMVMFIDEQAGATE